MAEANRSARALFEAKTSAASVPAEWWELPPGEYGEVVPQAAACCRYADLAILGQHEGEGAAVPEDFAQEMALGSGRPVLVVPAFGRHAGVGRRVLVAWNGSREAARALNDAIPLMRGAEAVVVLAFVQPEAGNVFVTVDVAFLNKTSQEQHANPLEFVLRDATGVKHSVEFSMSACETWSAVNLTSGASLGPKCLAFQAAAGKPAGLKLVWSPRLFAGGDHEIGLS